jgi:acetobutylicum phosphotransbutyrylase
MKKYIAYVLWLFWIFIIFYLSNQPGNISGGESSHLIYNTLHFIYTCLNLDTSHLNEIILIIHNPLRECMHSLEYLILGVLTINLLIQTQVKENKMIITILFCFIYAATDEIHQLFISGRTFEYFDIFMDMVGTLIGTLITKLIWKHKI